MSDVEGQEPNIVEKPADLPWSHGTKYSIYVFLEGSLSKCSPCIKEMRNSVQKVVFQSLF